MEITLEECFLATHRKFYAANIFPPSKSIMNKKKFIKRKSTSKVILR